jgi:hypothetical protein
MSHLRAFVEFPAPAYQVRAWAACNKRKYRNDGFAGYEDTPISLGPDDQPFGVTLALAYGERLADETL